MVVRIKRDNQCKALRIVSGTVKNVSFYRYRLDSCVCVSAAQPCPTLCNPMDCSPPGSSVHRILQARILEWGAISSSGDLPNPGIEPGSPALQADSLPREPPRKPKYLRVMRAWGRQAPPHTHRSAGTSPAGPPWKASPGFKPSTLPLPLGWWL